MLIGLLGVITIGLGIMQMGVVQKPFPKYIKLEIDESGLGMGVLLLGVVSFLVGVLGCLVCKFKKPCFAVPYIILTGIIGLVMLIIGIVALGVAADAVEQVKDKACAESDSLVAKYAEVISDNMCTDTCMCYSGPSNSNKDLWEGYGDEYLTTFGRSTEATNAVANANSTVTIQPLIFNNANSTNTVQSWEECYTNVLEPAMNSSSDARWDNAKNFIKDGGLDFMREFESKLNCAGVCLTPLFYTTINISEGKPT